MKAIAPEKTNKKTNIFPTMRVFQYFKISNRNPKYTNKKANETSKEEEEAEKSKQLIDCVALLSNLIF